MAIRMGQMDTLEGSVAQPLRAFVRHPVTDFCLYGRSVAGNVILDRIVIGSAARKIIDDSATCISDGMSAGEFLSVAGSLVAYLDGIRRDLSSVKVNPEGCSRFARCIMETVRKIPYGATMSYSEVGRRAGYVGAARAVASVMRGNRFPLVIPCHRVIRSDKTAGGFCGDTAGTDAALKQTLLDMERHYPDENP